MTTWIPRQRTPQRDGLLSRGEFDPVTWQILVNEGYLLPLPGGVAIPARNRPTPAHRAMLFDALVPPGGALAMEAACWVHVGGSMPDRIQVFTPPDRHRPEPDPRRQTLRVPVPDDDAVTLAGVRVTTPERTAVDLTRGCTQEVAIRLLRELAGIGVDLNRVHDRLCAKSGHRGIRQAVATVRTILDAEVPGAESDA